MCIRDRYTYYADFTSEQGPQLTYFGDAKVVSEVMSESDSVTSYKQYFDGATTNVTVNSAYTDNGAVVTGAPSSSAAHLYVYGTKTTGTMGPQTAKFVGDELGGSADDWLYHGSTQVSTPIHTSSHYQTFETPYLHELMGGDRNMEQTNLVVAADGKTWDQITRDTSYISNVSVVTVNDRTDASGDSVLNIYENWRGLVTSHNCFNKDFAIGYDKFICLKDGHYRLGGRAYVSAAGMVMRIFVNGNEVSRGYQSAGDNVLLNEVTAYLKRGDYFKILGKHYHSGSYVTYNHLTITKL